MADVPPASSKARPPRILIGVLLALPLGGCVGGDDEDGADGDDSAAETEGGTGDLPSPYADSDGSGGDVPSMGADEAMTASLAGLGTLSELRPMEVFDAFETMFEPEEGCPAEIEVYEEEATVTTWYVEGSCTTSSGLTIRGGGTYERLSREEDGVTIEVRGLSAEDGTLRLETGDGRYFELSGYAFHESVRGDGGNYGESYLEFNASIRADEQTAGSSALMDPSLDLQVGVFAVSEGPVKAFGGSGSIAGPGLGEALAFSFSQTAVISALCPEEPSGTFSVRDDAGFWHDIVFDAYVLGDEADEEPEVDEALCDDCGNYLAGGTPDGQACVDASVLADLLDWEVTPW